MMGKIVLVAEASGGLGSLIARSLAEAGHTVYAGSSRTTGRNASATAEAQQRAHRRSSRLRTAELNAIDQRSVDAAVAEIISEAGRIDVVIHIVGGAWVGPAEAFTPYQLAQLFDATVLSTQRVNRAVLPLMRQQREGLLVWVGPYTPREAMPYLAPYFGAQAAVEQLARGYAVELAGFGIDTTVVSPGPFLSGNGGSAPPMRPDDAETVEAYSLLTAEAMDRADELSTRELLADGEVAGTVVTILGAPHGQRPTRVTVVPTVEDLVRERQEPNSAPPAK
jgi:NAD(P)-dependent dehydrogenase (short-subunit alcohol dehydrogenase family)